MTYYGDRLRLEEAKRRTRNRRLFQLAVVLLLILAVVAARRALGGTSSSRVMLVTYFCPCPACCGNRARGLTASGRPAVGKLAAGPRWMKLGTWVNVFGYGKVQVLDRYARRLSDRLDLLVPDHATALRHGARRVRVRIERSKGR